MGVSYPAEPWDLHGEALAGVFLVPVDQLPQAPPPGMRVVRLAGRAVVTAAFFRYVAPSPLQYDEVMATVLVRHGLRLRVWITHIWVDSPASRAGGRELWAIPKELARFEGSPRDSMTGDGLAGVTLGAGRDLPGRLPLSFRIAQQRDARSVVTPVSGSVRGGPVRARWAFEGPLGWLAGRRCLLTVRVRRFHLVFGQR